MTQDLPPSTPGFDSSSSQSFHSVPTDYANGIGAPWGHQKPRTSALAITALVLAIVSLLLSWVPIVNNLIFFSGFLALVLGFVAWLRTRKGRIGGRALSVVSMLVAALSIGAVLATQAFYSSVLTDIGDSLSDAADGATEMSDDDVEEADAEASPLGESATVGPYVVTVTDVNLEADELIAAENPFNDEPDGRYVLASLEVTYTGDDEGDPWLDLSVDLAGSDARNYSTTTCSAVSPNRVMDVPTLRNGGQGEFSVCFDVPVEALDDPLIAVEESFSFRETRVFWKAN